MSRGAVQKYGVDTLSSMNAVGGGNNRPRMLGGTVYAGGGGHVHGKPTEPAKENRQSAEKQPQVPVDRSRTGLHASAADHLVAGNNGTPTVTPTNLLFLK